MDAEGLKLHANRQVTRLLERFGHTNRMKDEAKRNAWWWLQARGQAVARRRPLLEGRGVLWTRQGYAELLPIEVPVAGAGEVTVEILSSIVSPGTERAQYLRLPNARIKGPHRPGYSAAGRVVAVGPCVSGVGEGDLVAVRDVSHASVATVPVRKVVAIPSGVSVEDAALVKLAIISGQGVRHARLERGEQVCVIGAGLVGALAQRLALAAGAGEVSVIATSRHKERLALAGGAARFLIADEDVGEIAGIAAPIVIEATGDPDAVNLAALAAGEGGRIVQLGSPRGVTADVPLDVIRTKGLSLVGAHVETLTYEQAVTGEDGQAREARNYLLALAENRVAVSDLITSIVDPREAAVFYRELAQARDLLGARFDWTLLPAEERIRPARMLRLPDVSGRGVESTREPLPAPAGGRRRLRGLADEDPFAGATGRLRIAMLGCGDIGVHNAAAIAEAPNAELVACYDPVSPLAEDIATAHGAQTASTPEALVARPDVDAVFLAVPHHLHAPLGVLAAEHSKHVIVEKPPANDLEGAWALVTAAERAGVRLSFCFPQRYQPTALAAHRLIRAGAIGEFGGMSAKLVMDRAPAYWLGGFSGRATSNWREAREQAGGGVLIMNLSHYVDLIRHLSGLEVEELAAFTASVDRGGEVEDTVSLNLRFSNGAIGSLFGTTAARGALTAEFAMWGRNGHMVVEPEPRVYPLVPVEGFEASRWQALSPLPEDRMRAIYFSRFASAVARDELPEISAAEGLAVQAFIEAAYRSSETGAAVRPAELLHEVLA